MTGDHLRQRADHIGLAAVILGGMGEMLPWWAWRRRRFLRAEAARLMGVAQNIKAEVSHG